MRLSDLIGVYIDLKLALPLLQYDQLSRIKCYVQNKAVLKCDYVLDKADDE